MDPSLPLALLAVVVPIGIIVAGMVDTRTGRGIGLVVCSILVIGYGVFATLYLAIAERASAGLDSLGLGVLAILMDLALYAMA